MTRATSTLLDRNSSTVDKKFVAISSSYSAAHALCSLRKPPPSENRKTRTQLRRVSASSQGSIPSITIKDLYSSSPTLSSFQSSQSPLSSSIYSSMQLPTGCLCEHDGSDQAELLARAKRCLEIMRLSQQVKEAEAARARAANIKPLVWAKPTFEFELDSSTSHTTAATATDNYSATAKETPAASRPASLGKRKERQEVEKQPHDIVPRIP